MRTSAGALKFTRRSLADGSRGLNDPNGKTNRLPQQLTTTAYHDGVTAMRGGGIEDLLQRAV